MNVIKFKTGDLICVPPKTMYGFLHTQKETTEIAEIELKITKNEVYMMLLDVEIQDYEINNTKTFKTLFENNVCYVCCNKLTGESIIKTI